MVKMVDRDIQQDSLFGHELLRGDLCSQSQRYTEVQIYINSADNTL